MTRRCYWRVPGRPRPATCGGTRADRCRRRSRSRSCRGGRPTPRRVIALVALPAEQHDLVADARRASSPQSTISWSIVTMPTIGRRRPPISTSAVRCRQARAARRRRSRAARWPRWRRAANVWRSPYEIRSPAAQPLDERHPGLSDSAGRSVGGEVVDAGAGRDAVEGDAGADERRGGPRDGRARRPSWRRARRRVEAVGGSAASTSSNRSSWLVGVRVDRLVGDGEVGEHAGRAAAPARRGDRAATSAGTSAGRGADAVHAGVDLEVDAEVRRGAAARRARRSPAAVVHGRRSGRGRRSPRPARAAAR